MSIGSRKEETPQFPSDLRRFSLYQQAIAPKLLDGLDVFAETRPDSEILDFMSSSQFKLAEAIDNIESTIRYGERPKIEHQRLAYNFIDNGAESVLTIFDKKTNNPLRQVEYVQDFSTGRALLVPIGQSEFYYFMANKSPHVLEVRTETEEDSQIEIVSEIVEGGVSFEFGSRHQARLLAIQVDTNQDLRFTTYTQTEKGSKVYDEERSVVHKHQESPIVESVAYSLVLQDDKFTGFYWVTQLGHEMEVIIEGEYVNGQKTELTEYFDITDKQVDIDPFLEGDPFDLFGKDRGGCRFRAGIEILSQTESDEEDSEVEVFFHQSNQRIQAQDVSEYFKWVTLARDEEGSFRINDLQGNSYAFDTANGLLVPQSRVATMLTPHEKVFATKIETPNGEDDIFLAFLDSKNTLITYISVEERLAGELGKNDTFSLN